MSQTQPSSALSTKRVRINQLAVHFGNLAASTQMNLSENGEQS